MTGGHVIVDPRRALLVDDLAVDAFDDADESMFAALVAGRLDKTHGSVLLLLSADAVAAFIAELTALVNRSDPAHADAFGQALRRRLDELHAEGADRARGGGVMTSVLDALDNLLAMRSALAELVGLLLRPDPTTETVEQIRQAVDRARQLLPDPPAGTPPTDDTPARAPAKKPPAKKAAAAEPAGQKRCPACDTVKDVNEFARNRSKPDGLQGNCKPCQNAKSAESVRRRKAREAQAAKAATAPASGGPSPGGPPVNGDKPLSDAERERLRRRASELRDSDPAESRRIVERLVAAGLNP